MGGVERLKVGRVRQAGENFVEITIGIQATVAAAFDVGIDNGAELSGIRLADEQPVFLANDSGTNGIFHEVVQRPGLCRVAKNNRRFLKWFPAFRR